MPSISSTLTIGKGGGGGENVNNGVFIFNFMAFLTRDQYHALYFVYIHIEYHIPISIDVETRIGPIYRGALSHLFLCYDPNLTTTPNVDWSTRVPQLAVPLQGMYIYIEFSPSESAHACLTHSCLSPIS